MNFISHIYRKHYLDFVFFLSSRNFFFFFHCYLEVIQVLVSWRMLINWQNPDKSLREVKDIPLTWIVSFRKKKKKKNIMYFSPFFSSFFLNWSLENRLFLVSWIKESQNGVEIDFYLFSNDLFLFSELRFPILFYIHYFKFTFLFNVYNSSIFSIIRSTWFNYIQGRENVLLFTWTPKIINK